MVQGRVFLNFFNLLILILYTLVFYLHVCVGVPDSLEQGLQTAMSGHVGGGN